MGSPARPGLLAPQDARRVASAVAALALWAPAMILAARGIGGALAHRLPSAAAAAAGVAAIAVAAAGSRMARGRWPAAALPQGALVVWLATLSIGAGPTSTIGLLWLAALGVGLWALGAVPPTVVALGVPPAARLSADPDDWQILEGEQLVAESRHLQSAEGEIVRGRIRVDFPQGARTGRCHVAFCPQLAATPQLEWEQCEGPEARVQLGQALPQGVRFDVKLSEAVDAPATVWIEYVATCAAPG